MKSLKNKVIIVAGASGGIGRAVVKLLGSRGARVLATTRNIANIRPLLEDVKTASPSSSAVEADLGTSTGWETVVHHALQRYRHIDVLVNCTGLIVPGSLDKLGYEDIERVVSTNVLSTIVGVRSVLPVMQRQGTGQIVLIGSLGAILPMPFESLYCATKFAVRGFSLSLSEELKGTGITVSLVSPGPVSTPMLQTEASDDRSTIAFAHSPLSPEEVADAILETIRTSRRETLLPKAAGRAALLLGAFPGCFQTVYRIVDAVGGWKLRRYRRRYLPEHAEVPHA